MYYMLASLLCINNKHRFALLLLFVFNIFYGIIFYDIQKVPTRNFEVHLTSKHTELRNSRNFETHGTSKMSSKLLCILLYLNPYYSSYLTP